MSAAALKKLALGMGWTPEGWHLKFADVLGRDIGEREAANAVYCIFGAAVLRPGCEILGEDRFSKILHLTDMQKRRRAEPYLAALSQSAGAPVFLIERKPLKAVDPDIEFSRDCRARVDRLKVKTTNRGVVL